MGGCQLSDRAFAQEVRREIRTYGYSCEARRESNESNGEHELGKDEEDYSPTNRKKKTETSPAKIPAKPDKVGKTTKATKAGTTSEAEAGKRSKSAKVSQTGKANKAKVNSRKREAKGVKGESGEDKEPVLDTDVDP